MRFHFTPELFIGLLLVLWGASIIIKLVWGIDIPIFKPLLAIFLIYLGLSMLFGPSDKVIYKRTYFDANYENDTKRNKR
jgi:small neutral amino acid transporter SnatA (MarC family)